MAVTPNSLLQATAQASPQAKTPAAPVSPLANVAQPGDKAPSFAQLYAKESQGKPQGKFQPVADNAPQPVRDKSAGIPQKQEVASDQSAAPQPAVADSGKSLPADKPADKPAGGDDKPAAGDDGKPAETAQVETPPSAQPPLDPSLVLSPPVAAVEPAPVVPPAQPQVEAAAAVVVPAQVAAAVMPTPPPAAEPPKEAFDPEADPLDALPAVRLAMEQGGHVSESSRSQPKAASASNNPDAQLASTQNIASGMAGMLEQVGKGSTEQGGEKAFSGLITEGLKDLKGASSDTRVDDFANRLAALTQAATPKTANAVPVNQPLAMNQGGWTDEVVNRVMYLSSVNLKSADIQLQPAELGRLDIRVHMIPDQQTQVSFMSAHAGVREALEGQVHRMREMFQQQGLGQVDVNVSDQSRGWQGQEQAQQGQNRANGSSGNGTRLDGEAGDDGQPHALAEVTAPVQTVIGSSVVDYYA